MKFTRMALAAGIAGTCATLVAGCSPPKPVAAAPQPPFNASLSVPEFMTHVMEPSAERFWDGSGVMVDRQGIRDLAPTTEAGWKSLEDGAAGVAEAGNALMIPGRARAPVADWYRHAAQLSKAALEAKAVAEKHEKASLIEVGGKIDEACVSCHKQFWPGSEG